MDIATAHHLGAYSYDLALFHLVRLHSQLIKVLCLIQQPTLMLNASPSVRTQNYLAIA